MWMNVWMNAYINCSAQRLPPQLSVFWLMRKRQIDVVCNYQKLTDPGWLMTQYVFCNCLNKQRLYVADDEQIRRRHRARYNQTYDSDRRREWDVVIGNDIRSDRIDLLKCVMRAKWEVRKKTQCKTHSSTQQHTARAAQHTEQHTEQRTRCNSSTHTARKVKRRTEWNIRYRRNTLLNALPNLARSALDQRNERSHSMVWIN